MPPDILQELGPMAMILLLVVFLIWIGTLEHRSGKRAFTEKQHNMRILKLENYPNANDRLKVLEQDMEHMRKRLEKLESENPYERLRRIHP